MICDMEDCSAFLSHSSEAAAFKGASWVSSVERIVEAWDSEVRFETVRA